MQVYISFCRINFQTLQIQFLFRWCQILDDDIYEPVFVQSQQSKEENEQPKQLAVVSFQGLGEKYEKLYYEEATYGQVREREGRRGEQVQEGEGAWSGRLEQRRHWRGRSKERGQTRVRSGDWGETWRGRSPGPDDERREGEQRRGEEHGDNRGIRQDYAADEVPPKLTKLASWFW